MSMKNLKVAFVLLSLMATVVACGLPASTDATETVPSEVAATGVATQPSAPPTELPTAVEHQTIPVNLPDQGSGQAGDFDSSVVLANNTLVGGDRFTFGRFERPFNANTMDIYFSQLDIVDTSVFEDDTWIFGTIKIKELNASSEVAGKYAIELDTSLDGKGDWLIITSKPTSTDWGVNGVQVFEDANNDVGSELPTLTDEHAVAGDGFEFLVFDQEYGNDPDSAWARISPSDANTIEVAIKKSVLGDTNRYLINMWAGSSLLDPALFDINDHFSHEQAGAADKSLEFYYPIKTVSEIDNSCRMSVGFQPTGKEPGLCEAFIPVVPGEAPGGPSGCQATDSEISSCNSDPSYAWDGGSCSCKYVGPK